MAAVMPEAGKSIDKMTRHRSDIRLMPMINAAGGLNITPIRAAVFEFLYFL